MQFLCQGFLGYFACANLGQKLCFLYYKTVKALQQQYDIQQSRENEVVWLVKLILAPIMTLMMYFLYVTMVSCCSASALQAFSNKITKLLDAY